MSIEDAAFALRHKTIGEIILRYCNRKSLSKLNILMDEAEAMLPYGGDESIAQWKAKTLDLGTTPGFWEKNAGHVLTEVCESACAELEKNGQSYHGENLILFYEYALYTWAYLCKEDLNLKANLEKVVGRNLLQKLHSKIQETALGYRILLFLLIPLFYLAVFSVLNNQVKFDGCNCDRNVYNCDSFPSLAYAQLCFDYCMEQTGRDVHFLDRDRDGRVCEPSEP